MGRGNKAAMTEGSRGSCSRPAAGSNRPGCHKEVDRRQEESGPAPGPSNGEVLEGMPPQQGETNTGMHTPFPQQSQGAHGPLGALDADVDEERGGSQGCSILGKQVDVAVPCGVGSQASAPYPALGAHAWAGRPPALAPL